MRCYKLEYQTRIAPFDPIDKKIFIIMSWKFAYKWWFNLSNQHSHFHVKFESMKFDAHFHGQITREKNWNVFNLITARNKLVINVRIIYNALINSLKLKSTHFYWEHWLSFHSNDRMMRMARTKHNNRLLIEIVCLNIIIAWPINLKQHETIMQISSNRLLNWKKIDSSDVDALCIGDVVC